MRVSSLTLLLTAFLLAGLLPAGLLLAGERGVLEVFEQARKDPIGPSGRGRMGRAIEGLAAEGGVVSLRALGQYIHDGFADEVKLLAAVFVIKKRGREAFDGMERLQRELKHLRHREKAGATGLGPGIESREAALRKSGVGLETAKAETGRMGRLLSVILGQREACVAASIRILKRLPDDRLDAGVDSLRATLDVRSMSESLLLVRIMRQSSRAAVSSALLEICSHPTSPSKTRVEAACAIGVLGDIASIRALVNRIESAGSNAAGFDDTGRQRVLHAISRTARKKLDTVADVKAWLAAL